MQQCLFAIFSTYMKTAYNYKKIYIHKFFMAQVWSERQLMSGSTVFGLIFPSYLCAHYSNIFVMWPVTTILLHNRWFIQQVAQVSLGVPPRLVPTLSVSSADFICTFSLKWNKTLLSTHQARLNTDWPDDRYIGVCMYVCTVYLCLDSTFVS